MSKLAESLPPGVLAGALRFAFGLPGPLRKLITGPPITLDGQRLHPEAHLLLRLQQLSGEDWQTTTPAANRAALTRSNFLVSGPVIEGVTVRAVSMDGVGGRFYTPHGLAEGSPLLVFYHGGGWVSGDLDSHDNLCRFLAVEAGVRVLAADYRLAPEHPFPAAADDARTAYEWAVANASELRIDPARIAVGGDSAGGNLAAVTALHADAVKPVFLLLFYPAVDATVRRRSREIFGEGFFLTDRKMDWFLDHYAPSRSAHADPRLSVLLADDLSGLPPTYLATAGFDPLRDEGEAFAEKLADQGVPVVLRRYEGLFHGYANILGVGGVFREAVAEAVGALRTGLALANARKGVTETA
ncbi:alpha/beta hydrolase [Actinosynnema sp. NPDC047251]|uniref:Alpha/beta hydrolase fold-3 domain-containing protein n=1 Tax=Saccharothrix espanaensis (strain ATCC 51144 / DSM 44229 / JCM 9112 / NBRC 15066 / NRRL 15764) TaxID=1179773 RepID=K0JS33_SACES|nr:alpha/beta hydrolase [Saccharothrix espanaensis]CCH27594.1 alpha/beta hydrolase fold-3 domain-containing protein [Saccharothrix espanaensis DSM 44229]